MKRNEPTHKPVLVGVLKPSEPSGYTIVPYHCVDAGNYLSVIERLSTLNPEVAAFFPDAGPRMVELSSEIEPLALAKRFAKPDTTPAAFLAKVDPKYLREEVLPYIHRKIFAMVVCMQQNNIPLFDEKTMPHHYPENQIIFQKEEAGVRLKFAKREQHTSYYLFATYSGQSIDLRHDSTILLSYEPCVLVSQSKLYRFGEHFNGSLLKPFLSKDELQIPARMEKKYFSAFLKNLVNLYEVEAEGFEIKKESLNPVAVLVLENDWQGELLLTLQFRYGDKYILADNPNLITTEVEGTDTGFNFKSLKRQMKWEKSQAKLLVKFGLKPTGAAYHTQTTKSLSPDALLHFLRQNTVLLNENGFEIEQRLSDVYLLNHP